MVHELEKEALRRKEKKEREEKEFGEISSYLQELY
ncbi:hypothetical protein FMLHJGGC_00047 [Staphylococcus phage BSwM-KMM1]|nr:hypothetical protein FMLHJGGC_00047 [Pseudomonas phage BSwM KMM1]